MVLKIGLLTIIIINLVLSFGFFITQPVMDSISDQIGGGTTLDYDTSTVTAFDKGNYTLDGDVSSAIQDIQTDASESVSEGTTTIFTDPFKAIKDWLLQATGIKYILNFLNSVPNALAKLFGQTYAAIGFGLGWLWHILTVFAIISWIKGN